MKRIDIAIIIMLMVLSFIIGAWTDSIYQSQTSTSEIPKFYYSSNGKRYPFTDEGLQRAIWDLNETGGSIYEKP